MSTCSLLSCRRPVDAESGKVEVRAFAVTAKEKKGLKADWSENGDAVFHHNCWSQIVKGASRTKSETSGLQLNELETKLVKEAKKTAEFHDPDSLILSEAKRIAKMLKTAKHPIFFTGAGISTAAGIGDFRGKDGKWTQREKKQEHGARGGKKTSGKSYSIMALRPTYTHEAICKLLEMGVFKYVISQNVDGLHRLSCVPEEQISELHGNAFVQKCEKCDTRSEMTKSHRAMTMTEISKAPPKKCEQCRLSHRTGLLCSDKKCGGYMMNTIINFGDYLETDVVKKAQEHARRTDLVMCLGSTLRVTPASDLVEMGQQPIRLIICNRQGTPYDDYCRVTHEGDVPVGSRTFGDCDKLMKALMREILGDDVTAWEKERETRMAVYDEKRRDLPFNYV